ncbi:MAG: glycosyltransferase family 39 protein [Bacteroidota bacterium]|nr:glycosyltransferase family 39 protein [Bacteroidota bacterium]
MRNYYAKIRQFSLLLTILGLALLIRICIALYFTPPQLMDEKEYLSLAQSLQTGNGFSINNIPTAYRVPAYPSIMAFGFTVFGKSITVIRVIQSFSDTLSCLFIFLIANRLFSSRTAYLASFLYAIFPGNALYVSLLLSEIFFTTFFLVIIFLYTNESTRNSLRWKIIIGCLFAILTLLRQNAPVVLITFIVWELISFRSWKVVLQRNIFIVLSFTFFLSPWMMRNKIQFDYFSLTSNGGINFWIGHNEEANGSYRYITENNPLEYVTAEFDKSLLGYKKGFIFLLQNPIKEVKLAGLKFAHFFEPDFALQYSLQFKADWQKYTNSLLIYREFSPLVLIVLHTLSMVIILSAFWTLIYSSETSSKYILLFGLLICLWISVHLVFFGAARFRIPIMPLFIILSSYTLEVIRERQFSFNRNKNIIFVSISATLIGSWTLIFVRLYFFQ